MKTIGFTLLLVLVIARPAAGRNSNQALSIQGVLRDAQGALQSQAVSLDVSLYASQMATNAFYTQHFPTVPVDNGFFAIEIGGDNLGFSMTPDAWVGVQVGGDPTELPRQHLTGVPYAFNAAAADTATTASTAASAASAAKADTLSSACNGCVTDAMIAPGISAAKVKLLAGVEADFEVSTGGATYGLQNGWILWPDGSYAGPGYFKDAFGIVHLRGLLGNGPASKAAFTLKPGYAPAFHQVFTAVGSGVFCEVRVFTDGTVVPMSSCSSNGWISLDGISFRAK
jgi:hypothetical protein